LVAALDDLQAKGARLESATAADRSALDDWQRALLTAARRLEAAWLALEEQLAEETNRWREAVGLVAAWRRPLWPVAAVAVPALAAAGWLGLILGGYARAPGWLQRAWSLLP
jgi:predicted acyl esterase